jgi:hypothetical protein
MDPRPHPAKYSAPIVELLGDILTDRDRFPGLIVDPFAGTGRIHDLGRDDTLGVELEPEWSDQHPRTITGDARNLDTLVDNVGTICTSPTYGNRMADTYDGRDGSRRHTYTIALGRALADGNTGALQWGRQYRDVHLDAWVAAVRALRPDGALILNISDHIRAGRRQYVTGWHVGTLVRLGLDIEEWHTVGTARQRHGANGNLRVDGEAVIILRKPAT